MILLLLAALQTALLLAESQFDLEHSKDDFGMHSHGIIETLGSNRGKFYPLPQSTAEQYRRLRPDDVRLNPFMPE